MLPLSRYARCFRGSEATSAPAGSRGVDEEYRPEERDEGPNRQVPSRSSAAYDEKPENYHRAHDLGQGERGEGASPPEGRAQHRHQLDVAPAHASSAYDGDQKNHTAAHERTERRLDDGWIPCGHRGQAQRVRQPGQGNDIGDHPDPQIKDHDQREPADQRKKLPPPRRYANPSQSQQREAEGQARSACERDRPGDLGEPTRYFVDGDPVEGCPGINRGAG